MTINFNMIKKTLTMALAAICLSLPLVNTSEAANHKTPPPPPPRHEQNKNDVHFFKGKPPKNHKVCKNPYHARWSPHFHCSKYNHHHENWKPAPPPPPHHNTPHNHR